MSKKPKHISDVISGTDDGSITVKEKHTAMVNALLKARHGVTYSAYMKDTIDTDVWGPLQREAKWWLGGFEDAEFPPPANVTPERVVAFFQWFRRAFPGAALPATREKVLNHWAGFVASEGRIQRTSNVSMVAETDGELGEELRRFDAPDYTPLTGEALAEFLASRRPRFGATNTGE